MAKPKPDPVGVHTTHCCPIHGCKYSNDLCPVKRGFLKPEHSNNNGCEQCEDDPGSDIDVLIENIAGGSCDPYLEAILAAAHGRKRALRNVTRPYGRRQCE